MNTTDIKTQDDLMHYDLPKILFVLIDGLGDVCLSQLGDCTPLSASKKPHMDLVAKMGISGLLDPVEPGLACGSDTAHLSLFGLDPFVYYRGRGAYESLGAGIDMKPGDIAFKSNFATWDPESNMVTSRRADRQFENEGPILCDYLNGISIPEFPDYQVTVKYATEHRCGISIRGPFLCDDISGTDPLRDGLPLLECRATVDSKEAHLTSRIVNSLSKAMSIALMKHPINADRKSSGKSLANIILLRGCGSLGETPSFQSLHSMQGFMIAPTCIIAGLGKTLGLDVLSAPGATGDYHSNFMSKGRTALEALPRYDFGFIHIKAVDDAGHDKNVDYKIKYIEAVDDMLGLVWEHLRLPTLICITGDHSTPVLFGDHSNEPVPVSIALLNVTEQERKGFMDSVDHFDEMSAAKGALGRFNGTSLMSLLKNMRHSRTGVSMTQLQS